MEGKTNNRDMDKTAEKEKEPSKDPRKRFLDAAPIRVRNVLKHLRLVSNLLNRNYTYKSAEFQKIIKDISDELDFVKNKFKAQERKKQDKEWKL